MDDLYVRLQKALDEADAEIERLWVGFRTGNYDVGYINGWETCVERFRRLTDTEEHTDGQ